MSTKSRIRDGLRAICKATGGNEAFSAEVTDVDTSTRSCTVIGISDRVGTEYTNVWLMPEIDDGILYIPKIGSTVIVANNKNLQPYVVMFSELTSMKYVVANTVLSITNGLTQFNAGENLGLVNVAPLVEKLNNLENLVNDLISKYNSHTHAIAVPVVGGGGGTATGTSAAGTPIEGTTLTPTVQADIEDTAVTH